MRFRSLGESGTNIRDYLSRLQDVETNFITESILSHIGAVSLNEDDSVQEGHLGCNSLYRIKLLKRFRRRGRKIMKSNYYRKKFFARQNKEKIDRNK